MNALRPGLAGVLLLALAGCFDPAADHPDAGAALVDTLSVSPAVVTLPVGTEVPLTLTLTSGEGVSRDATTEAEWAIEPSGPVTIQAGRVRAVAAGAATVTASLNGKTAKALVTVPTATIDSLALDADAQETGVGGSIAVTAVATLTDASRVDVTASATWAIAPASVGSISASGVFKALAPGKATLTATLGTRTATKVITVRDAKLIAIGIKPSNLTLPVGSTVNLRAEGTYDDGLPADLTLSASWASSTASVKVDAQGHATAQSAGSADVTASFGGLAGIATLTVTSATLTSLVITPAARSLPVGGSTNFTVEAKFSDGSSSDFTEQAVWTSSVPASIAVSNAPGTRGKVSALNAGSATLTARFGSVTAAAQVTATASVLTGIMIAPSPAALVEETTVQFSAQGTYSDGTVADITSVVNWSALASAVLTISPGGKATGVAPGTTQVLATQGNVMAQVQVTVTANPVVVIAVLPTNLTVAAGATAQLHAVARRLDNTLRDVTEQATWNTLNATFATVADAAGTKGLVRGVANGVTQVEASLGGMKGSATITVSAPTIVAMVVSPPVLRMPVGYEFASASLAKSDGTTEEVGGSAVWTTSNAAVAEVQIFDGYAYVIGKVPGTATITASAQGQTANCFVTVTNATLTSIQITPSVNQLQLGASQRLQAVGVYSDFSTATLTYYASWTSSQSAVAQVDNSQFTYDRGKVTALSAGTTVITANFNGVTGTLPITVSSATVVRVQVAPFAPRLPVGFDTYMRATAIFSDNTTLDVSYDAAWTSSAPAIASVDPYGRAAPHQPGTATVRATWLGVTGTTDVTVTSATLQSIAIVPGNISIAVQATQFLQAMGTFSDGTTLEVTWYVTWLSSQPAVADVRNDYPYQGELKGLSTGTTTLTAIRGSVQGSAQVTVP